METQKVQINVYTYHDFGDAFVLQSTGRLGDPKKEEYWQKVAAEEPERYMAVTQPYFKVMNDYVDKERNHLMFNEVLHKAVQLKEINDKITQKIERKQERKRQEKIIAIQTLFHGKRK